MGHKLRPIERRSRTRETEERAASEDWEKERRIAVGGRKAQEKSPDAGPPRVVETNDYTPPEQKTENWDEDLLISEGGKERGEDYAHHQETPKQHLQKQTAPH